MRACRPIALRFVFPSPRRLALLVAVASASVAFSVPSRAAVPAGWALESTIDGGTSSLGSSIATTDAVAVVGAPFAVSRSGGMPTGAAFVYTNAGSGWISQELAAPTPINGGDFGTSVAVSGGLLAVGAGGTPPAAYLFATDGGSYASVQTWTDPTTDKNASFGGSVAVFSGGEGASYVAIAAPPGSANTNGTVYVARETGSGAWAAPLVALTDPSAQSFGISIAFAANGELLVGDPDTGSGQVLVYAPEADGGWESEGTLPFSLDGGTVQQFGNGIATWNGLAVVAAPGSSDTASGYNGAVFVFASNDAGVWSQEAVLAAAPSESFGNYLPAIQGGLIAVGSAINTASSGTGRVDVWALSGSDWVSVPSATLVGDSYYGQAVGVVGGTLFVGDTSGPGASSISAVTSALFIETAEYGDAGTSVDGSSAGGGSPDGGSSGNDASLGADGSFSSVDGSVVPPGADAAASADGGETGAAASTSSSSGCSCTSAGHEGGGGALAILAETALVLLAWGHRRRARLAAAPRA